MVDDVQPSDAGDYSCTLYSPQDDVERLSFVVRVIVRGQSFYIKFIFSVKIHGDVGE